MCQPIPAAQHRKFLTSCASPLRQSLAILEIFNNRHTETPQHQRGSCQPGKWVLPPPGRKDARKPLLWVCVGLAPVFEELEFQYPELTFIDDFVNTLTATWETVNPAHISIRRQWKQKITFSISFSFYICYIGPIFLFYSSKKLKIGTSLVVQWLRFWASNAGVMD